VHAGYALLGHDECQERDRFAGWRTGSQGVPPWRASSAAAIRLVMLLFGLAAERRGFWGIYFDRARSRHAPGLEVEGF